MIDRKSTSVFARAGRFANALIHNERQQAWYHRVEREYSRLGQDQKFDWNWKATHYNRIALLTTLAARHPESAYLEIGCFKNALFDSLPLPVKVGVDPVQGGTVRATSDEFFASNTQKFDLIFIDGLHTYEQVHRDVANSLKAINPGGWIAMHDMLPGEVMEQHEPFIRTGRDWVGQGWKVAFELLKTEGVDFKIVKIDHGVGVIRVITPGTELADLSGPLNGPQFPYFCENYTRLPLVTWDEALPWLRTA
ncbi:class I SAM-dependent methyltransferase [Ancylobacter rudongensis]|uniref:Methyltransferase domain-containing protein n=1 Tax=Ancylobacter rudongensis TaxID=177413 RepID=A0A1G4UML3_9HYPH|nr:class I SAM-dependent methyltransferase [Ancylobacter rudongensis]SCW94890.1 Methyltransferase domain-containing protein [Ancylobacter rudongensis]